MRLTDRYTSETGRHYLTGIQALVRLPLDQMRRDRAAGLNTGTFISGYEGSPLGGYDLALARVGGLLRENSVHFVPAVNEDLAATAILGSQIRECVGPSNVDGVVGIWYGKGPGVDRSGDILRHANLAGSPGQSAALVLAGDDHGSKSSTIPHQSDFSLYNFGIPVLVPGNTQDILDLGLAGIALSRYTGAWAGLKLVTNVCDGGGTVDVEARGAFILPDGYQKKNDPRLVIPYTLGMEVETNVRRLDAAKAFARANRLNTWHGAANAKIGIVTAGKPYFDLMQALADLGIAHRLDEFGIRIAKYGMTFPIEGEFTREFADGLETLIVIEEKRSFVEMQLRELLYDAPVRPKILGKDLIPAYGEIDPDMLALVLSRVLNVGMRTTPAPAPPKELMPARLPNFCPGCPHNRSTILLEGQVAGGGTGCHGMAIMLGSSGRSFSYATHMGGEGAPWIGMAPFSERGHIFQNIGDGTFFHSGSLAVQACIAAGVNITFKVLYNGHVAMTGGQAPSGVLAVPELTRKLEAEGVKKIVVLVEDVERYASKKARFASVADVRDREELATVLRELEATPGVTAMIYDQECAAEKRRQRSRGKMAEPTKRLVIAEEVCEGCDDCVIQSNCMSLVPVETSLGPKMSIHQSSCNKDYSCALGDCPSFVTVEIKPGTGLPKRKLPALPEADVAEPREMRAVGDAGYRILMPGIGGTGVITINALLATAATIDGLNISTLDQTGLAQKGGAVVSHLTISRGPLMCAARINTGNADLILGFDVLGATAFENLKCASPERTAAVLNNNAEPAYGKRDLLRSATRSGEMLTVDANRIAEALFGNHLSVNTFLMGFAWQAGFIPVSRTAIEEAIRLNGVEAESNLRAFLWGRKYYADAPWVDRFATPEAKPAPSAAQRLDEYQNSGYAREHAAFVERIAARAPELRDAVSLHLYRLMAYKDEYEVARLLTKPELEARIRGEFESVASVGYNLHPPLWRDWGLKRKIRLGAWARPMLKMLATLKVLRGTPFDIFGYARHRREERELIGWYRETLLRALDERPDAAAGIAALPASIRGYGEIKSASIRTAKARALEILACESSHSLPSLSSPVR